MINENIVATSLIFLAGLGRIPRIVERWKAPFLRGAGWFFGVEVAPDFEAGAGASILRRYRLQLFLPWAIELPIVATLLLTGHARYVAIVIAAMTLLTRVNYYAARMMAEGRARKFELCAIQTQSSSTISLSLRPRILRDYTNPWIEIAIAVGIGGSLAWIGVRYLTSGDWHLVRQPFCLTLVYIYLQAGFLLLKRGIIRARYAAPAGDTAQHLAWRESLRRLSAAVCDYSRILFALGPIAIDGFAFRTWENSGVRMAATGAFMTVFAILTWLEWKRRREYLDVARRTRPAKLLAMPDLPDPVRIVCFQPARPALLLCGSNGYSLNLASAAVKSAGLYVAGCALLCFTIRLIA